MLGKPAPSGHDPRARLKRGFQSSRATLIETIVSELSDIVDLDDSHVHLVGRLCQKAALTWFDFQMHRCRIVVGLTGSKTGSPAEKATQVREASLVLTLLPMVGRHGNVEGVDLENFTTINGCAGETLTIP